MLWQKKLFKNNTEKEKKEENNVGEWDMEELNDVEYIINANKGVVVCKIYNCENIALKRVFKYTNPSEEVCYSRQLEIPNVFVGVAKCAPDDKWDEEYGKKLALTRAKSKRGKAINNVLREYIKDKKRELEVLERYGIREVPNPKEI